jgi:Regulator of ribonuclease activity B
MAHNFDAQRRETFDTFKQAPKGQKLPAEAVIDYLFIEEEQDANWKACEAALRAKGFKCSRDAEWLVASFGPIPVTPEAIWAREEMATKIALAFDFYPDGWDLGLDG